MQVLVLRTLHLGPRTCVNPSAGAGRASFFIRNQFNLSQASLVYHLVPHSRASSRLREILFCLVDSGAGWLKLWAVPCPCRTQPLLTHHAAKDVPRDVTVLVHPAERHRQVGCKGPSARLQHQAGVFQACVAAPILNEL